MMTLPLAKVSFLMGLVGVVWVFVAIALILIVLVQKGKGGGLSAAFGGAGAGGLLGTKTGDFLTWVTISLVAAFFVLSVVMVKYFKPTGATGLEAETQQTTTVEIPTEDETEAAADEQTGDANKEAIDEAVEKLEDIAGEAEETE